MSELFYVVITGVQGKVGDMGNNYKCTGILYTYKFSRDIIFVFFTSNLLSTKIKSLKFYKTITMHIDYKSW